MPLLFQKHIDHNTKIGVWHITENAELLINQCKLTIEEQQVYNTFQHENRKKHWLSYRILAGLMLEDKLLLEYNEHGKPLLKGHPSHRHISVSHSGTYSAVIISKEHDVGIDIEKIAPRLDGVKERYLSTEELYFIDKNNWLPQLTICWAAKEAIYKIFGIDFWDFATQMHIKPFVYKYNGEFEVVLNGNSSQNSCRVQYQKIEEYFLAYVII